MGRLSVAQDFAGPLVTAEKLWYDTARWPAWVDGLARVSARGESWPATGSELRWESHPGGRGQVRERVTEFTPGHGQSTEVSDERMRATQRVEFEALDGGVSVRLSLHYELLRSGPLARCVDLLFIRRALTDSLRRTLERFGRELADMELLR